MKYFTLLLRFWKTIFIGFLILVLCLIPSAELQKLDIFEFSYTDNVGHLIMFLGFSAVLYKDLIKYPMGSGKSPSPWILVFMISLFLGMATETLQYFLSFLNRTANIFDLLSDCTGAICGITAAILIKRKPDPGS